MPAVVLALLVVVEVSAPDLSADDRHALEVSCSEAVGGRCVIDEHSQREEPDAVAIVSLSEGAEKALVEVGRRENDRSVWFSRELDFEPEDVRVERFRAIGLTVATLVGDVRERERVQEEERKQSETAPAPPPSQPKPAPPAPPSQPPLQEQPQQKPLTWLFQLGPVVGPGLDQGPWRIGGFARGSLAIHGFPVRPTLAFAYAKRKEDDGLGADWLTLSGGVMAGARLSWLGLYGRVEGVAERFGVEQTLPPTDTDSRWVPGLRLGGEIVLPDTSWIGWVFGADFWQFWDATEVHVAGADAARLSAGNYTLFTGVQLRVP